MLTDLDRTECPLKLIQDWLPFTKHPNFLFRIAVREVEAWVLADRQAFSKFIGVKPDQIPPDVDKIDDPKQKLINIVRKSRNREIRDAIVPRPNSTAKVGPDYNGQLSLFVENCWNVEVAMDNSLSLRRAVNAVSTFQPI